MAGSTTTRTPALENRPTVNEPKGADRTADIVLGGAVIAMGLLAGLSVLRRSPRSPSSRRVAPARPGPRAGSSPASPSRR